MKFLTHADHPQYIALVLDPQSDASRVLTDLFSSNVALTATEAGPRILTATEAGGYEVKVEDFALLMIAGLIKSNIDALGLAPYWTLTARGRAVARLLV